MKIKVPIKGVTAEIKNNDLVVSFDHQYTVLSSGLMNAGLSKTQAILNHHVGCNKDCNNCKNKKSIVESIDKVVKGHDLADNAVILMTAADMENHSMNVKTFKDMAITALITAGTSNATRAGDPTKWHEKNEEFHKVGTINVILITNGNLTNRAMVGSIITATEAKTAALFELGVKSKYSGKQATGTGTDSIAIASDPRGKQITYAGAHSKFGEMIGKAVYRGVIEAIGKQDGITLNLEGKNGKT